MHNRCFKKGFTLTELLTVIGIIMILAMLAAAGVRKAYHHSQKLRCVANLKNLYTMSLLYFQDYKVLPTTLDAVQRIAKDQAKDMVCPAISGSSSLLLPIQETISPINKLHMFMNFPEAPGKHPNYPLFSDTDIQSAHSHNTTPPHNGVGYAVLTSGKIIEFTMTDIDADPFKYLVTVTGADKIPPISG